MHSAVPPPAPPSAPLRWPLPALLVWAAAWGVTIVLSHTGLSLGLAVAAGLLVGGLPALSGRVAGTPWRRAIVAGGFPVSLVAAGLGSALPAWAWLLAAAALLAAYPVAAWRDAPMFPTPRNALAGLERHVALPPGASVLDAGCGLGDGLRALRAVWPQARISGVERSWPLRLAAGLRCPWARVERGDMWRGSWAAHDLVYLFQRPESMARALAKARAEMRPGSWLVSLEFEVPGRRPRSSAARAAVRPGSTGFSERKAGIGLVSPAISGRRKRSSPGTLESIKAASLPKASRTAHKTGT